MRERNQNPKVHQAGGELTIFSFNIAQPGPKGSCSKPRRAHQIQMERAPREALSDPMGRCVCLGGWEEALHFGFFLFSVLPCPSLQAIPWCWWRQCVGRCLKL